MKKLVGKQAEFVVQGFPAPFRCMVVGDQRDMVLVRGEKDTFIRRIIKRHIVSYMPLEEIEDDTPLLVLHCENPSIGCPGVQYIKAAPGFNQNDFNAFMGPCKARCETCRCGSKGDLKSVDGAFLKDMVGGTMFGDYPEEGTQ